jgi:hypothetical protein
MSRTRRMNADEVERVMGLHSFLKKVAIASGETSIVSFKSLCRTTKDVICRSAHYAAS